MPIVDGIDTKGDEKTVLPTRFLELENVVFTAPGSLRKRFGYEALPNDDLSDNPIETGSALSNFRNELLLYSNSNLYTYSEGERKWEGKGEIKFCNSSSLQVSADNLILENPSSWTYGGVTCFAYEQRLYHVSAGVLGAPDIYDEYKNLQIILVDNVTNTILSKFTIDSLSLTGNILEASCFAPKVGFTGTNFVITFLGDFPGGVGGLKVAYIDYLNPKVITISPTNIQSRGNSPAVLTDFRYDVLTAGGKVFVAYVSNTLDTKVIYIDNNLNKSAPFSLGTSSVLNNISMNTENGNLRILLTTANGFTAKAYLINYNLTAPIHPPLTITALPTPAPGSPLYDSDDGVYTITGVENPSNPNQTLVFVQIKKWKNRLGILDTVIVDSSGNQLNAQSIVHIGLELQSKPINYDGFTYFFAAKNVDPHYTASGIVAGNPSDPTKNDPEYQVNKPARTSYLIKHLIESPTTVKTEIVGQYDVDSTAFVQSDYASGLPNCFLEGPVVTRPSAVITTLQPAGASRILASTVIKKQVADFSQTSNYFDASQGEALHISGGLLKMYDGHRVVEHGFLDAPEAPKDISPLLVGSGGDLKQNLTSGVEAQKRYLYCSVYKWTDRTGKIHRSTPSLPVSLTTPGTAGIDKYNVTLRVIPCYLSTKENLEIEIYRTTGNGGIFYRLAKIIDAANVAGTDDYMTGSYPNDKFTRFIKVIDSVTDIELSYSEPLYTTGGVLENDSALSSSYITSYKARIFLILSDGFTLQYSKVSGIGDPVAFNSSFKIPLDDKGGKATALSVMDDHLLIFKERAIFALTGEGPNELGQQDDYRTPYLITADAGCTDPNSIVQCPEGVMFKSAKGIYMLKRNFGLQYVGDSVEKFNGEVINSATLLSSANQIRLVTASGTALVYDYYSNRWSTFTNIRALDTLEFNGSYYYVRADGLVYKETPNLYQDNGQFITMRIKSAWVQIGGVQGFQRFYKMLLLGTYKSAHKLLVKFGYDFNPFYKQETLVDVPATVNPLPYGSGDYGAESPYGGEFPLYQWSLYPKIQKCQSFQFEISDVRTDIDGESFSLSHILAEIGLKEGTNTVNTPKTSGAK